MTSEGSCAFCEVAAAALLVGLALQRHEARQTRLEKNRQVVCPR